jgi:hypothetical protein
MSPLEENTAAWRIARAANLELCRTYRKVSITDPAALKAAGYTTSKPKPDYARIVEAIDAGLDVPGAELAGLEYVLRPRTLLSGGGE